MSNRRRPRNHQTRPTRQVGAWPEPGPGQAYCTQPAVALNRHDEANVHEARTASHDALLEQLGDRQRAGVWWTHHHAGEASQVIDDLFGDGDLDQREQAIVAELRAHMQDPSALLVIAWCIGQVPEGVRL